MPSKQTYKLILDNVSKHINLTEEEEDHFISLLQHKKLRKRQYLLQEGDICKYEHFVIKGCLRAYEVDNKGIEHVVQFAIEDWWISDLYSLLSETPARYNIDALENSEVLLLSKAELEQLYLDIPKFERFFRIILQRSFVAAQRRVLDKMSKSAEDRYLDFIERYPTIEQRISNRQIASFMGITPESLSRIRQKLTQ